MLFVIRYKLLFSVSNDVSFQSDFSNLSTISQRLLNYHYIVIRNYNVVIKLLLLKSNGIVTLLFSDIHTHQ